MRELMIAASEKLASILALRDSDPDKFRRFIQDYALKYCREWDRSRASESERQSESETERRHAHSGGGTSNGIL